MPAFESFFRERLRLVNEDVADYHGSTFPIRTCMECQEARQEDDGGRAPSSGLWCCRRPQDHTFRRNRLDGLRPRGKVRRARDSHSTFSLGKHPLLKQNANLIIVMLAAAVERCVKEGRPSLRCAGAVMPELTSP